MTARAGFRPRGRLGALLLLAPLCACADGPPAWLSAAPAGEDPPLGVPIPAPAPEAPVPPPPAAGPAAEAGVRLLAGGNPEAAIRAFRRALVQEGPTPETLIGLGAAHRALGRLGPALDLLSRAAARWPDVPAARNNHGAVLYDLGRYAAAEAEFRAAADIFMRRGLSPTSEILRNLSLAARARQPEVS